MCQVSFSDCKLGRKSLKLPPKRWISCKEMSGNRRNRMLTETLPPPIIWTSQGEKWNWEVGNPQGLELSWLICSDDSGLFVFPPVTLTPDPFPLHLEYLLIHSSCLLLQLSLLLYVCFYVYSHSQMSMFPIYLTNKHCGRIILVRKSPFEQRILYTAL